MNAYLLSLNQNADITKQWDFGMVKDLLKGKLWKTSNWVDIELKSVDRLPEDQTAIVVLPARHHAGIEDKVNKELNNISRVILFLLGDEEADYDIEKISHNNIKIWVQNPHHKVHDQTSRLGTGYPQHLNDTLGGYLEKSTDVYFAGQVTHQRREELQGALNTYEKKGGDIKAIYTEGFTQGLKPEEYYKDMKQARITPCPSGAVIPDSFRLFESLETMSIPIADQKTPDGTVTEYWDWLFEEITPFPKTQNFDHIQGLVPEILNNYPDNLHKQTAWWIKYKRKLAYRLQEQISE